MRRIYFPVSTPLQVAYLMLVGVPVIVSISWMLQTRYDRWAR